jgi:hypothetical protein
VFFFSVQHTRLVRFCICLLHFSGPFLGQIWLFYSSISSLNDDVLAQKSPPKKLLVHRLKTVAQLNISIEGNGQNRCLIHTTFTVRKSWMWMKNLVGPFPSFEFLSIWLMKRDLSWTVPNKTYMFSGLLISITLQ